MLTTQQGEIIMLVGQDSKVSPRPVTLGQEVDNDVLVLSGLKPGERVIVEGTSPGASRPAGQDRAADPAAGCGQGTGLGLMPPSRKSGALGK